MKRVAFKLLCSVVFLVQILAASGVTPGGVICQHSDGTSTVETLAELAECHARQQLTNCETAVITATGCVDSLVLTDIAPAPKTATAGSALFEFHAAPLVLPAFVPRSADLFAEPRVAHPPEQSQILPDVERLSLGSVILVI